MNDHFPSRKAIFLGKKPACHFWTTPLRAVGTTVVWPRWMVAEWFKAMTCQVRDKTDESGDPKSRKGPKASKVFTDLQWKHTLQLVLLAASTIFNSAAQLGPTGPNFFRIWRIPNGGDTYDVPTIAQPSKAKVYHWQLTCNLFQINSQLKVTVLMSEKKNRLFKTGLFSLFYGSFFRLKTRNTFGSIQKDPFRRMSYFHGLVDQYSHPIQQPTGKIAINHIPSGYD